MRGSDQVVINLDIEPTPQLRPRATRRGGFIHVYDQPKVKAYKLAVKRLAEQTKPGQHDPLTGPLEVKVTFYRTVQRSLSKAETDRRLTNKVKPTTKPDVDNYIKALLDALNGILWKDDAQIVKLEAQKRYAKKGHVEIVIDKL